MLTNLLCALFKYLSSLRNIFNIEGSNCETKKSPHTTSHGLTWKAVVCGFPSGLAVFCEPQCTAFCTEWVKEEYSLSLERLKRTFSITYVYTRPSIHLLSTLLPTLLFIVLTPMFIVLTNSVPRFNRRFTFMCPPNNISAILDAAKVADSLLCVVSPTEAIDGWGETCLTCLFAQGLPATTLVVQVSW